jgi:hypothetical protein
VAEGSRSLRGNHLEPEDVEVDLIAFEKPACPLIFIVCYLNISKFQEGPKRFERSKAVERLERRERAFRLPYSVGFNTKKLLLSS